MALYSAGSRLGLKARAQGFGPRLIPALHFNLAASPQFLKIFGIEFLFEQKNERTPEAKLAQKAKKVSRPPKERSKQSKELKWIKIISV